MTQHADPIAAADALLRATDTAELLTKAYALTHRMHMRKPRTAEHVELRAQRDLISAEIIRRTTEGA